MANMANIRKNQIRRARIEYYMNLGGYSRDIAEQVFDAIGEKRNLAHKLPTKLEMLSRQFHMARNQDYWQRLTASKDL